MQITKHFHSTRQEGFGPAHEGHDHTYWLPGVAVRVSTYGRRHGGCIEFSFVDKEGHPVTAQEWCREARVVQAAKAVKVHLKGTYTSAGLSIRLETDGRSHGADFSVEPTAVTTWEDVEGRHETTNVLG